MTFGMYLLVLSAMNCLESFHQFGNYVYSSFVFLPCWTLYECFLLNWRELNFSVTSAHVLVPRVLQLTLFCIQLTAEMPFYQFGIRSRYIQGFMVSTHFTGIGHSLCLSPALYAED